MICYPKPLVCVILFAICAILPLPLYSEDATEQPQWERFFEESKAEGTIVVLDGRGKPAESMVFDRERAKKRFAPASTFKIPHALFALEAGVIRDEFEVIAWDGIKRPNPAWNRDQNLRSSMRHSVVWVYQKFAKEIGIEREREYLKRIGYGNEDPAGKDPFWIDGSLQISANEQVAFLMKLHRNELPFGAANQRLVKDLIIVEAGRDWTLRGKTGWSGKIGWWVGWVEHPSGAVFFAMNIDTPNGLNDMRNVEGITRGILASLGALSPDRASEGNR